MKKLYTLFIILSVSLMPAISMAYTVDFSDGIGDLYVEYCPEDGSESSYEVSGGSVTISATPAIGGEEDAGLGFYVEDFVSGNTYDINISGKFKFVDLPDAPDGRANIEFCFTDSEWVNDYYPQLEYTESSGSYILHIESYLGPLTNPMVMDDFYGQGWFTYEFTVVTSGPNDILTVTVTELEDDYDVFTTSASVAHTDGFTLQAITFITDDPSSGSYTAIYQGDDFSFSGVAPLGGGVPEPSTIILILLGFAGLVWKRFKK